MSVKHFLVSFAFLTITLLTPLTMHAEEGMFYRFQVPYAKINTAYSGIDLTPEKVERVSRGVFKVAIGDGDGGSGSFISPDGLVLTNHHIADDCIQDLRSRHIIDSETDDEAFASDRFYAEDYGEELPCSTYALHLTEWVKDATHLVVPRLPQGGTPDAKAEAVNTIAKELVSLCEGLPPDLSQEDFEKKQDELTFICVLNSLTSVERYFIQRIQVLRDVRLVYAPSKDTASFGQDRLNFQYPRHAADFAFLRAYGNSERKICDTCSPYGHMADIQNEETGEIERRFVAIDSNNPLDTSDRFLIPQINTAVQDNDFVMIMGYPGDTARLRSHFSIAHRQFQQHPFEIAYLTAFERVVSARIAELSDTTENSLISEREKLKGLRAAIMNGIQAEQATLDGLVRIGLLNKKIAVDERLSAAIAANPEFSEKYGDVLPTLEAIYRVLDETSPSLTWLGRVGASGIFSIPWSIVSIVEGLDPNSPHPTPSSLQGDLIEGRDRLLKKAPQHPTDMAKSIEFLATALGIHQGEAFDIPLLEVLSQDIAGHEKLSPQELATNVIKLNTRGSRVFSDDEFRSQLLMGTYEQLKSSPDPAIAFVLQLKEAVRPLQAKAKAEFARILAARTRYYEAIQAVLGEGGMDYYDANFSERFTYGRVAGYTETAGEHTVPVSITSTFGEIPSKTLNGVPLTDLYTDDEKTFAQKADKVFGAEPVNFIATLDITGGNSGSAVLNKDLQVVGTAFDGNWVGIVSNYAYDITQSRTVSVSLPFAVQYMNADVVRALDEPEAKNKPNRITQELEAAVRGESSFPEEPPQFLLPRDPNDPENK